MNATRRGFFVALAAMPFIPKMIKHPTGPVVPKADKIPNRAHDVGDFRLNIGKGQGVIRGWECVESGAPGKWRPVGHQR